MIYLYIVIIRNLTQSGSNNCFIMRAFILLILRMKLALWSAELEILHHKFNEKVHHAMPLQLERKWIENRQI